jgi:hypothetical protein
LKQNSTFFTLANNFRHKLGGGMLIYLTQRMKMVPNCVRANVNNLILGTNSPNQMDQVAQEFGEHFGGEDNFKKMHRRCVSEKYQFMYCRLDQFPPCIHKNFEREPVYIAED